MKMKRLTRAYKLGKEQGREENFTYLLNLFRAQKGRQINYNPIINNRENNINKNSFLEKLVFGIGHSVEVLALDFKLYSL